MTSTTIRARDKREGLKDAHTKQLYEEPEMSILTFAASDIITASGDPENEEVDLPKVEF